MQVLLKKDCLKKYVNSRNYVITNNGNFILKNTFVKSDDFFKF